MTTHGRVLAVDDHPLNRDILCKILRRDYDVETAVDGDECLRKLAEFRPQVVLLDIMMPGLNGYEVCRRIKEAGGAFVQVILVSGKGSTAERLEGYAALADDYLVKPFDHDELRSKVRVQFRLWESQRALAEAKSQLELYAGELERLVQLRTRQVVAAHEMTVFALAELADSRDPETGEHLLQMRYYSQTLAQQLATDSPYQSEISPQFLEHLYRASPLHDVGKVGVPDAVLQKPGPLTPAEREVMKRHVVLGAETLEKARSRFGPGTFMDMAVDIARYHHEWFDGAGYCAGLAGATIPLAARIVALADVYDALTSQRVYKAAMSAEAAREVIVKESGTHFDPAVVAAFLECFASFQRFDPALDGDPPAAAAQSDLPCPAAVVPPALRCPAALAELAALLPAGCA